MENSFQAIGWEKICLFKSYLKILGWIVVCRDVGTEVKKWSMVDFMKMHIVSLYLRQPADNLCDHTYPHMGKGVVI